MEKAQNKAELKNSFSNDFVKDLEGMGISHDDIEGMRVRHTNMPRTCRKSGVT